MPALRLAWIAPAQLRELLTSGLLSSVTDNVAVQQAIDDALERQVECSRIRKRYRGADDDDDALQCPIMQEVRRADVVACDMMLWVGAF